MTADVAEKEGLHKLNLSGTKFRKMLRGGERRRLEAWVCVAGGCAGCAAPPTPPHVLPPLLHPARPDPVP